MVDVIKESLVLQRRGAFDTDQPSTPFHVRYDGAAGNTGHRSTAYCEPILIQGNNPRDAQY